MNYYPYLLAVHIIFVVTWFASLFYIVRLFIYHTEALQKSEPEKHILSEQFKIMEKRLMHIIGTPSMVLAVSAGIALLCLHSDFLKEGWMHIKITLVMMVIVYHFRCLFIMKQLARNQSKASSFGLRLFNELATLLLVAIVFLVVLKNTADMLSGLLGLIILAVLLMIAARLYKRSRQK